MLQKVEPFSCWLGFSKEDQKRGHGAFRKIARVKAHADLLSTSDADGFQRINACY